MRLDFRRNRVCYGRRDILREQRDRPDNIFLAVATLGNSPTRLEVYGEIHRQVNISVLFKKDSRKLSQKLIDDRVRTLQNCMRSCIERFALLRQIERFNSREIAIARALHTCFMTGYKSNNNKQITRQCYKSNNNSNNNKRHIQICSTLLKWI